MPRTLLVAAVFMLSIVVSAIASAQVADHLECYKIRDPVKLRAFVDLDSPQFGLAANCKVSTAKLFCVPAEKAVISAVDKATRLPIAALPVTGPDAGDRVCYKVKCSEPFPPDTQVSDQFGTRTIKRLKTQMLCAPAVKGVYQRFVDNGDGTVTDRETRLQWEKKDTAAGSGVDLGNPHDVDNTYSWGNLAGCASTGCPNGATYTDFLAALNDCTSSDGTAVVGAGFAGHCDWRLPTSVELQTILLASFPCSTHPCADPVFGPTTPGGYWSATTHSSIPFFAWDIDFYDGLVFQANKTGGAYVRAVRSGT